ncbi:MAG: glycerate kinase [Bacteroidota bacterium]|jgi:glycerate kinase
MRILLAPDKFRGSMSALEVCESLAAGIRSKIPNAEFISFPLADGGEGMSEILTYHASGHRVKVYARDPLGRRIEAAYGVSSDGATAFIEMAEASGLHRLSQHERDVMKTTSVGTGDLILHAIESGVRKVLLGIGGSATNDGAAGAAYALGYRFYNAEGEPFLPVGGDLVSVARIDSTQVHPALRETEFIALCDVDNPFYGPNGAAFVYGPQKGATPRQVEHLDAGLRQLAVRFLSDLGSDVTDMPGAGGGGGFGGGAVAFFRAVLRPGVDVVFEQTNFKGQLRAADVVITGEGKIDHQTLSGKVVAGVARLAKGYGKLLIGVAGVNELSSPELEDLHLKAVFSITDAAGTNDPFRDAGIIMKRIGAERIAPLLAELA